jgi:FXSXX-COOH protein
MTATDNEAWQATGGSALIEGIQPVPLPDLSDLPLAKLRDAESPVLIKCIARLLREVADPDAATAGFNSAV